MTVISSPLLLLSALEMFRAEVRHILPACAVPSFAVLLPEESLGRRRGW